MQDKLAENSEEVALIPNHSWDDFIPGKERLSFRCKGTLGDPVGVFSEASRSHRLGSGISEENGTEEH